MPRRQRRSQLRQSGVHFHGGYGLCIRTAGWSIRRIAAETHLYMSTVQSISRRCIKERDVYHGRRSRA